MTYLKLMASIVIVTTFLLPFSKKHQTAWLFQIAVITKHHQRPAGKIEATVNSIFSLDAEVGNEWMGSQGDALGKRRV